MFGFLIGGLAAAWGVMVAVLDHSPEPSRRLQQLCTALLVALGAVAVAGGVSAVTT
ncbi:hypothetical protein KOI35_21240 [Actinoplanes bogorensis]|uniref:Uncharacterized protein n=1 Tax=Paractinoplanes bogorensis TaxID=1610840 RepID=A0ABS5YRH7_9ACTN|nr:hypothetical protein [Actinoplanes bogorensis]MBU2666042.1 hypothetical protein [Actinoplanes bogorensis]